MAKSHLSLTLCFILKLFAGIAAAQDAAPVAIPKPDQTPAPAPPGVRQIPPPKAPAPTAPTTVAPALPSQKVPVMAPSQSAANPKATLQKFADGLAILLLNLGAYQDPNQEQKNRSMIALKSLKGIAYDVQMLLASTANDPVMRYISFDLLKQLLRLEAAFHAGNLSYARYLLRQITHYTIPWQPGTGSKALSILQFTEPPAATSDLEKAEYYAAIKRYEDAMLAYERVLSDKQFRRTRPEVWERAVENLMAITIRVRNDAHITLEMSSALREESISSPAQKEMLQTWRSSAKTWTTEGVGQKMSGAEFFHKAQQIADKGDQLSNKGKNLGTIEYLRVMSLLNELVLTHESDALKAKGFLLTGKTREKLGPVFIWMHADAYYEACIRVKPRSAESRECLRLFENFQTQHRDAVPDREKLKQLTDLTR